MNEKKILNDLNNLDKQLKAKMRMRLVGKSPRQEVQIIK